MFSPVYNSWHHYELYGWLKHCFGVILCCFRSFWVIMYWCQNMLTLWCLIIHLWLSMFLPWTVDYFNNGHLKSIIINNGHLKVKKMDNQRISREVINDVRMRSFQGSQDRTAKITQINRVEDFAFSPCTSLILLFRGGGGGYIYFSMKWSYMT